MLRYALAFLFVFETLGACSETGSGSVVSETGALCSDEIDNDGDGFVDCGDQDCWSETACSGSPDATDASEVSDTSGANDAIGSETQGDATPDALEVDIALEVDQPETTSCECGAVGSIKGRVCAPSEHIFVSDAHAWIEGTGCDGAPFLIETQSSADGTYYLLDVPCGTHTLNIEKGSFSAQFSVTIAPGQLLDATGAATKLCFNPGSATIAVLAGTWDDMGGLLEQLGLRYDFYNDHGDEGADGEIVALLSDSAKLATYDIVFANCGGTVGWLPQDEPQVMPNVKDFVLNGGSLYMSDYAWVLGEWSFPDKVEWQGNDDPSSMGKSGSPQVIPSGTKVNATIVDGALAGYLGKNTIAIEFDQGPQIAPVSVANGAFAHVIGDINVPLAFSIRAAPLALSYVPASGAGRVIYTNFHNDAQTTSDMLTILNYLVFTL